MSRPVAVALLLFCTMLWGFAFIAQKSAMDSMGPLTFTGARFLLGGVALLPLAYWEYRRRLATGWVLQQAEIRLIALVTVLLFFGSYLQQLGLLSTTATNGGFLTSLYVLFVPLIAYALFRVKPHPVFYIGVPLALVGIFYLNGGNIDRLTVGDLLVICSAVVWAGHVLSLSAATRRTGLPIFVSTLSFLGAGSVALIASFVVETPSLAGLEGAWPELLYAGFLSTAVAFTLQAVGQQYVPPANAAIILSAESLFAAIGGAVILHERLPPIGYAGAALIFATIVMVEALPPLLAKRQARAA